MHLRSPSDDAIITLSEHPRWCYPLGICLSGASSRGCAYWSRGCTCSGADNPRLPHNTMLLFQQHRISPAFRHPSIEGPFFIRQPTRWRRRIPVESGDYDAMLVVHDSQLRCKDIKAHADTETTSCDIANISELRVAGC